MNVSDKAAGRGRTGEPRRAWRGPALFSHGFRPFFLGAGVLAALAVPVWVLVWRGDLALTLADPLLWHRHEMLFGYLGAALAGFVLTAVPNWTRRLPIAGWWLAGLAGLWLAGRLGMLAGQGALALVFPVVLAAVIWREVLAGRNWRNLPVCLLVSLFALGDAVFLFVDADVGQRLGFGTAMVMLMLIGGRVVPSFTRNWLAGRGAARLPAAMGRLDRAAILAGVLAVGLWLGWPGGVASGVAFAVAALLNLVRLGRWRGLAAWPEPLLAVLHLGYGWLVLALGLMAAAALVPEWVGEAQALHALGAGAIGQMTLAVMTRAILGHTGRALHADWWTVLAYALVALGAGLRIVAGWSPAPEMVPAAALAWSGGFAVFVVRYGPLLLKAR